MSSFPSLPLFTDAYIADTTHLTMEEHGAYLRLLMFAWRSKGCRLANDDVLMARMLGIGTPKWLKLKPAVMAFWTLSGGYWTQRRLSKEHAFVAEKVKKRRAAGKLGGRPKSLPDNDQGKAKGSEKESKPKAPTPTPTPTDSPKAPKGAEPGGFAEFRAVYPKRSTAFPATEARKRWLEACRKGATPAEIIAGARAYAAEQSRLGKVGTGYVATANVWLNQGRWKDYLEAEPTPQSKPRAPVSDETWRERMRMERSRGGHWPWRDSPPPNDPRTLVPRHILAEFQIPSGRGEHSRQPMQEAAE